MTWARSGAGDSWQSYCSSHRDHDSRVTAFRESQDVFGRRGAAAMASRQRSMLILDPGSVHSRRTRSRLPSPWFWISKTSPDLAAGMTTRRLASALDVAMVGLSHQLPASAKASEGGPPKRRPTSADIEAPSRDARRLPEIYATSGDVEAMSRDRRRRRGLCDAVPGCTATSRDLRQIWRRRGNVSGLKASSRDLGRRLGMYGDFQGFTPYLETARRCPGIEGAVAGSMATSLDLR